ncbi:unnamed protein product [Lampetra fluviatilis]
MEEKRALRQRGHRGHTKWTGDQPSCKERPGSATSRETGTELRIEHPLAKSGGAVYRRRHARPGSEAPRNACGERATPSDGEKWNAEEEGRRSRETAVSVVGAEGSQRRRELLDSRYSLSPSSSSSSSSSPSVISSSSSFVVRGAGKLSATEALFANHPAWHHHHH